MKNKLRKQDIRIKLSKTSKKIHAAFYTNHGCLDWEVFEFSDLPNDRINIDDLKRFGINIVNV